MKTSADLAFDSLQTTYIEAQTPVYWQKSSIYIRVLLTECWDKNSYFSPPSYRLL